jgi:Lon protease-like protein
MVEDALRSGRHIGMIQPIPAGAASDPTPVYRVGCAGRITTFQETEDDRFLIQLTGVCRFRIAEELSSEATYRSVRPDWQPFLGDLEGPPASTVDIKELEVSLRSYLESRDMKVDWSALRKLPPAHVVDFLTVNLPLEVEEKQTLVELPTARERAQMLRLTLETAVSTAGGSPQRLH